MFCCERLCKNTEATENSVTILDEEQVSPIRQVGSDPTLGTCTCLQPVTSVSSAQTLEDVDSRLTSLSDKINLCNVVLSDLKDLNDILVVGHVFLSSDSSSSLLLQFKSSSCFLPTGKISPGCKLATAEMTRRGSLCPPSI